MVEAKNNLIAYSAGDKYGYIDAVTKEWVIKPMFEYTYDFIEGRGIVKFNGMYGIISSDLKWILPPSLNEIFSWRNKIWACVGKKWGALSLSGEWEIKPQFDEIWSSDHGYFGVKIGGLKGIYDVDYNCIYEPEYDSIEVDGRFDIKTLSHYVIFNASKDGKSKRHVLKFQENDLLNCEVVETLQNSNGLSDYTLIKRNDKYGVINANGYIRVQPKYKRIVADFNVLSNIHVRDAIWAQDEQGWHLIASGVTGNIKECIIRDKNNMPDVELIPQLCRGLSPKITTIEGKEMVLAYDGYLIFALPPLPLDDLDISEKRGENDLIGLVDKYGNWIVEPAFTSFDGFINGVSVVSQLDAKGKQKEGLIDKTGVWVAEPKFDRIWSLREGMHVFEKSKKCGVMNEDGKIVAKNIFLAGGTDAYFKDGRLRVKQQKKDGRKFGYLGTDGKWAIEPIFDDAKSFYCGEAEVNFNGQWVKIDLDGNFIPPLPYNGELDWQSMPEYTPRK